MTDNGMTVTTPNPTGAGSGEVIASPIPTPEPISTNPSKGAQGALGGQDLRRPRRRCAGILVVVLIARDRGVLAVARHSGAGNATRKNFFTYGGNWITTDTSAMHFGILDLIQVTVFVSLFSLILAMPVAFGIAIFLTQYSPKRLAGPLGYVVDLLAAVPSIVYGVWGLYVLAPVLKPFALWLNSQPGAGSSCSGPAPRRWRVAGPSSRRASCWP